MKKRHTAEQIIGLLCQADTAEERAALQRLVRRQGAGQAAVMRARIVLAADAEPEATNSAIAARLGISRQSVITWR